MKLPAFGFGGVFLSQDLVKSLSGFLLAFGRPGPISSTPISLWSRCTRGLGGQIFLALDGYEGGWAGSRGSLHTPTPHVVGQRRLLVIVSEKPRGMPRVPSKCRRQGLSSQTVAGAPSYISLYLLASGLSWYLGV